ncbi:endonuclease III, partial [Candidatus Berkelbacteria bacterium CG06_land_8_20_14_3_00_43_10]
MYNNLHMTIPAFQKTIWDYYHAHPRPMPWRETTDPYHIYVSEVMLQQTQVDRVLSKYTQFVRLFPNWGALADAPLTDVLRVWQGLGYNRRALLLQKSARIISDTYSQKLPNDPQLLEQLPGIGHATARSIVGFAYNKPVVFIETNIRSVFIHFFFSDRSDVDDTELLPLIKKSCHQENVREWYWALMDYGVMLKKSGNPSKKVNSMSANQRLSGRIDKFVVRYSVHLPKVKYSKLNYSKWFLSPKNDSILSS